MRLEPLFIDLLELVGCDCVVDSPLEDLKKAFDRLPCLGGLVRFITPGGLSPDQQHRNILAQRS